MSGERKLKKIGTWWLFPDQLMESAKLSVFFENLLTSNHTLGTMIAATIHSIQPRAGNNIRNFNAINEWYKRLDKRYNLSLSSALLPLMTTNDLKQLTKLKPPFLEDLNDDVNDQLYHDVSEMIQGNIRSKMMFNKIL